MKLSTVINPTFNDVLGRLLNKSLPVKTAYKLRAISKAVDEQRPEYERGRRDALEKYGEKNEDGSLKTDENNNVVFSDENLKAFVKELDDLVNIEFTTLKLKLEELGDDMLLSAQELGAIEDILEF